MIVGAPHPYVGQQRGIQLKPPAFSEIEPCVGAHGEAAVGLGFSDSQDGRRNYDVRMGELDEAEGVLTLVKIAIAHIAAEIAAGASKDEMPRIEATVLHTAISLARQRVRIGDYPRREILVVETAAGEIAEPKIAFEEHPVAVIESRESFCRL